MKKIIAILIGVLIILAYVSLQNINNSIEEYQEKKEGEKLQSLPQRATYLKTRKKANKKTIKPLMEMIEDAEKDGMCLVVLDAYRTESKQRELYNNHNEKGVVAKPGESEHETGNAFDFFACPMTDGERDDDAERPELKKDFKELPEYEWLRENAYKYNFYQTYKGNNQSTIPEEPWHWTYKK